MLEKTLRPNLASLFVASEAGMAFSLEDWSFGPLASGSFDTRRNGRVVDWPLPKLRSRASGCFWPLDFLGEGSALRGKTSDSRGTACTLRGDASVLRGEGSALRAMASALTSNGPCFGGATFSFLEEGTLLMVATDTLGLWIFFTVGCDGGVGNALYDKSLRSSCAIISLGGSS